MAVEWLTEHGASFFDLLSLGVESVIDGILCVLLGIPFYIIRKMRILMQRKQRRHGQAAGPGGWIRPLRVQKKRIGFYGSAIIE